MNLEWSIIGSALEEVKNTGTSGMKGESLYSSFIFIIYTLKLIKWQFKEKTKDWILMTL